LSWNPRHNDIIKILSLKKQVGVGELADRLNVSEVTVRKDLSFLEDMGFLVRARGAALLAEDRELILSLKERSDRNIGQKKAIAQKALELVREGDTIFIDAGSTCRELALLVHDMNLRVVSNSIDVLFILADAAGIALYSLGGSYRRDAGSFIGPLSVSALKDFQLDISFLGSTGFTSDGVFSAQNLIESEVKKEAVHSARRSVVLSDSSKFGIKAFSVFARDEDIDILVTDKNEAIIKDLEQMKIEIMFAETEQDREEAT
jgi:DeoR/GlpR family transcriptional regulator of sugar metabolism